MSTRENSPRRKRDAAALRARLAQRKGEVLDRLRQAAPENVEIVADPAHRHDPFPLTDIQYAYWIGRDQHFELGNVAAHAYAEFDLENPDLERLAVAWQRLIARHEMLRAIVLADGQQQILTETPPYRFQLRDLTGCDDASIHGELAAIRDEMSHRVAPTDRWPLFDIRLTRLGAERVRLHLSIELIIVDGWSLSILFREWQTLYANPDTELPTLTLSFRDYVLAERASKEGERFQRDWMYWRDRLDTLPPAPALPLACDPGGIGEPYFTRRAYRLPAERWTALQTLAQQLNLTPSTLLLTAFSEMLGAWSKQSHFTLNLALFERMPLHPQVNEVVGDFTPLMLLEVDRRRTGSFADQARRVQQQLWNDLDHRRVNGMQVLRELNRRQGNASDAVLMPVVFTSMLSLTGPLTRNDMLGEPVYASQSNAAGLAGPPGTGTKWGIAFQLGCSGGTLPAKHD